jgi:hypothetical protein
MPKKDEREEREGEQSRPDNQSEWRLNTKRHRQERWGEVTLKGEMRTGAI